VWSLWPGERVADLVFGIEPHKPVEASRGVVTNLKRR
jgi:hypothetical protein